MTQSEKIIRKEILSEGKISFARFIQIALYHPKFGYYSRINPIGTNSHYLTSPYIHPAFGAALSQHIYLMWKFMKYPNKFQIVELGCSTGILAETIYSYSKSISLDFANSIQYIGVDRTLNKKTDLKETREKITIKTRQYAKRQSTWARGQMMDWQKVNPKDLKNILKKIKFRLSKT